MAIRQLAPDVAAKIAAGEVVERPASVVKELIENSIDAGATQIRVDLVNGGLQLIRVTDNGSGIPVDELSLALARHATSKVAQIDDLEHIRSLGFRGEALASIAAVADVTLLSRHSGAKQGAQISAANGTLSDVSAAASPEGTTLTVRNLFSAVPARLKFLKSRNTEVSHCHHMLEQYALAYPEIRFSVLSEGRQIFSTAGDEQLFSVLVALYGLEVAGQMVPISSLDGRDEDPERPVVSGYTSQPACYKSTRQHISFFVNRRWVLSRVLTTAVEEAYHSLLLTGRHPIAVVNISLDPTLLDVNVHPAKTEIRFLKERRVYAAVLRAVRRALLEEAEMPTWGNDKRTDTPQIDVGENPRRGVIYHALDSVPTVIPPDNPWLTVAEEETGTKPPVFASRLWQSHVRSDEPGEKKESSSGELPSDRTSADTIDNNHPRVEASIQSEVLPRRLPVLRVIGQLLQSFIVTEGEQGMYVIDQHAAHERVLLERMLAALKARPPLSASDVTLSGGEVMQRSRESGVDGLDKRSPLSQMLLTPLQLELAPQEVEAIEDHLTQLEQIGFALEMSNANVLVVKAVPNVLMKQINTRSVRDLLTELTTLEREGHSETWEEHALANIACKAAIKANYFLTVSEMREMIEQLEHTDAPYSCCHGRPTMVHFSRSAIERELGRR